MKRRDFLKAAGAFGAYVIGGSVIVTPALLRRAEAMTGYPIASLHSDLDPADALLLIPSDAQFAAYQIAFNTRTAKMPQVRVVCRTPKGVATAIAWARANHVPFAIRSGGHSYEGLSQSDGLAIDTRLMKSIVLSQDRSRVTIGAGSALGEVYAAIASHGLAVPAGSCPTVGVSGHSLGGGFGLLARPLGLAADSVTGIELVDVDGKVLNLNATENTDLYWALRGGGQGSFGVVTEFEFQTHQVPHVTVFGIGWTLPPARAMKVMKAWQAWSPSSPDAITSIFRVSRASNGEIAVHCAGQSIESETKLRTELARWIGVDLPSSPLTATSLSFIQAVRHFAGSMNYTSSFMKGKSDYLFQPMSDQGILTLLDGLKNMPPGEVAVMCDSYGGAVNRVAPTATAFAHRAPTLYSMQYYSSWTRASQSPARLEAMSGFYNSMRPYVSGASYVNYCDLELKDYATAYWGANLPRLQAIKKAVDPDNFFHHAQSIPLPQD